MSHSNRSSTVFVGGGGLRRDLIIQRNVLLGKAVSNRRWSAWECGTLSASACVCLNETWHPWPLTCHHHSTPMGCSSRLGRVMQQACIPGDPSLPCLFMKKVINYKSRVALLREKNIFFKDQQQTTSLQSFLYLLLHFPPAAPASFSSCKSPFFELTLPLSHTTTL